MRVAVEQESVGHPSISQRHSASFGRATVGDNNTDDRWLGRLYQTHTTLRPTGGLRTASIFVQSTAAVRQRPKSRDRDRKLRETTSRRRPTTPDLNNTFVGITSQSGTHILPKQTGHSTEPEVANLLRPGQLSLLRRRKGKMGNICVCMRAPA